MFDNDRETTVVADASPVGLGAVLLQKHGDLLRPVSFASRSLSKVEKLYSQTEKDALALVWACERFSLFLIGRRFRLITDHKPLEIIYGPKGKPSARIERCVLRLQSYQFDVSYQPGKTNIADPLSHLSTSTPVGDTEDTYIKFVATAAAPCTITPKDIERASSHDEELTSVRDAVQNANRDASPAPYRQVFGELAAIGHLILRGPRIVTPASLRERVLALAHAGLQDTVNCKDILRSKVWWPGIDRAMEQVCRTCKGCQIAQLAHQTPLMTGTELPTGPWVSIAADVLRPLPTGEHILVVADYYSRFYEVDILRNTTTQAIISCLDRLFSRYGAPYHIITDNGHNS